jgi:RHS repeat-associated protein
MTHRSIGKLRLSILVSLLINAVLLGVGMGSVAEASQSTSTSCTIDLVNNTHTCGSIGALRFVQSPSGGRAVLALTLDPLTSGFLQARFDVTYNAEPSGWTVNIGDSATDDGGGGDAATQSNDAELQVFSRQFTLLGNDDSFPSKNLQFIDGFAANGKTVSFTISNDRVDWITAAGTTGTVTSPFLFALAGQVDREGPVNYDIYAAFNRVIGDPGRSGSGVSQVVITLFTPQPPETGDGKAAIQYTGASSGDFHDPATLSAVLLDTAKTPAVPIPGAFLTFRLGQQACKASTDAQGRASCSLTPEMAAGDQPLKVEFAGDFVYAAAQVSATFSVGHEQSHLAITSPPVGPDVPASVRAALREDGAVPIAGRTVLFQAGAVSATATTGADGTATAKLALPAGDQLVTASFAGDDFYSSTSATQTLRVLPPQIAILPQTNAAPAGSSLAVTVQILNGGVSLAGERLGFEVLSGPNAGAAGACDPAGCASDSSGRATFRYTGGPAGGRDTVRAWLDLNHNGVFDAGEAQATTSLHWTLRHPAAILAASPQGGDYHDPVRLSATLLDTASAPGVPVAGALLSFASPAGSCSARTDSSGTATCFITPQTAPGSYAVAVGFAGAGRHLSAQAGGTVVITPEQTTLAITSPAALESGGAVARAVLREDGSLPVGGRAITFRAGGQTFSATTDAAGVATVTLGLAEGEYTLEASFAGDAFYEPATDQVDRLLVYQRGQFVVWGGNAPDLTAALPLGATYTFWGALWADQVRAGDFSANSSFKGYAADVSAANGTWESRPGNSSHPPSSVPAYMGVILSTQIQKDGSVISGNIAGIGVLRVTDPSAYQPDPGHAGTGVLLALLPADPGSSPAGALPGAPTDVSAVVGDGFAEVRWTPPADPGSGPITGYVVTMSPGGLQLAVPAGETSRIVPNLAFGASYQFMVAAVSRAGSGPASQPSGAVTLLSTPSAPQAVSAVAANATATVTWSAPAADGGSPILGYVVEPLPDGAPVSVAAPATTATLTGLENGTSYTFVVRARNAAGVGAESAPSAAVLPASPPTAPSGLVASPGDREATLYWTAPAADGGSVLTGYRIVTTPGGLSVTVPGDRTFAQITGLDNAVGYRFTLVAANAQGDGPASAPSDEVIPFGPPGAPSLVQGTQSDGTALVRWSAPASDGGRPIFGYTVTAEPGSLTAAVPAGETSRLITGLTNGTAYTVQVTATNLAGAGPAAAASDPITLLTFPDEPTGVQATGGNATATVTWVAPASDGGSPIQQYVVVSHPGNQQVVVDGTVLRATVSGLTNGTSYVFTVRAANAQGSGPESIRSNFVIPVGPPAAPTNVLAALGGVATARVSWSAPANGGRAITGYNVTASPGGLVTPVAAISTSVLVRNLTVGTAYTFTVTATNQIGTGPASLPSNSVVAATVPGVPTNVIAVEVSGGIKVSWTPPASDGFSPITLYQIFINPFGLDAAKLVGGSTTSLTIGGIPLGLPISFVVQAINTIGAGPNSAVSNTITLANPPGAPGNVIAVANPDATVQVRWTAPASNGAPITSYTILSTPGGVTATVDGTVTSAAVSGLTIGTTYTFTVTATNRKGPGPASAPSNPVKVTGTPPTAEIQSPVDGAEVTAPTQIVGTATASSFQSYILEIAPAGESNFTRIGSGTAPVAGGVLGTLDPTLLLNDLYTLRLTVLTTSGGSASTSVSYAVGGGMKVGNFTLSYQDLTIPLSGLPITVVRNYDSRDKHSGDFGYGWTLALHQGSYRNNRKPGLGWEIDSGFLPCQQVQENRSHSTVIRISDAEVYRFRLNLTSPAATTGGCFADAHFEFVDGPVPGATLSILGNTEVFYENGTDEVVDTDTLNTFEPRQVRLTTRDGRTFDLDLQKGVTRVQDLNGNNLVITSAGITHSSGSSVAFVRDGAGRITAITDPNGKSMIYSYDATGDLVAVTDRENQTSRYTYDGNHRILSIQDPRGITPVRNEYDADGRLIRNIDAFGKAIEYTHDLAANQEIVTDRLGHSHLMEYDDRGNVVREVDALGHQTARAFDDHDHLLSETDALGETTIYTYDAAGNRTTVTDPEGNRTSYAYDEHGYVQTVTDPNGKTRRDTYDSNANLLSITDPLGNATSFTYDGRGQILTQTDAKEKVTSYEYNAFGNRIRETDPLGRVSTYTYDAQGHRLTETRVRTTSQGNETVTWAYSYDLLGRQIASLAPDGAATTYTYDKLDNLASKVDALGRATTYTYDELGRLVTTTYPDGTTETSAYDEGGRRVGSTDRAGRATRYEYDALGQLVRTVYPNGSTTSNVYNDAKRLIASTDTRGNTTTYEYDRTGRRTRIVDSLGNATTFEYDANGNQVAATDAKGHTTKFRFDGANRETTVVFPDGTSQATSYDSAGRRSSTTDPTGKVTHFEYDALGRLVTVTDPLGHVTGYEYDEVGNRIRQTDANGHSTQFDYDARGRMIRRTLPLGASESLEYNLVGNLVRRTDLNGAVTTFTYDTENRLTGKSYPDGSSVTLTYSPTGKRATAVDGRGTTNYQYDVRDRLIRMVDPAGRALDLTWNGEGSRTSLTASVAGQSLKTSYDYDALNRLTTVLDPQGRPYSFNYDEAGYRTSVTYPNGIKTRYEYDSLGRLTVLETSTSIGAVLQSYAYTLDASGRRTRIDENDGTARIYGYDDLHRLTQETVSGPKSYSRAFSYDAVGNRLFQEKADGAGTENISYSYDERDRLLATGGTAYTWDEKGQLKIRTGVDGATYVWDFDGRLKQVLQANGTVITHAYDADGNRVRTEITPSTGPPSITEYLVDPSGELSQVIAETDGFGNLKAYYVRGNDLLAVIRPTGARFFHADGLGSVHLLTDETGTVTDTYSFSAFGELLAHAGSDPNTYLFAGEPLEPNSGLYALRARWMDPEVGRFASIDPFQGTAAEPRTLHRYSYVYGDPVNATDPTGRIPSWLATLLVGTRVHQLIGAEFKTQGPRRFANNYSVYRILEVPLSECFGCEVMPDLVDANYPQYDNEVYEIKPRTLFVVGFAELDTYLGLLSANDPRHRNWTYGYSFLPTPNLFIPEFGGFNVEVDPPEAGVILYRAQGVENPRIVVGDIPVEELSKIVILAAAAAAASLQAQVPVAAQLQTMGAF